MVSYESIFDLNRQIVDECLYGDCQLLALCLSNLLKPSKIYHTSSSEHDFIHVAVSFNGYLIDALGIHTEEEFLENHLILYDIDPNDLKMNEEMDPKELENIMYHRDQQDSMKLFERYANCILESFEFKFFLERGHPNRTPIIKHKYY